MSASFCFKCTSINYQSTGGSGGPRVRDPFSGLEPHLSGEIFVKFIKSQALVTNCLHHSLGGAAYLTLIYTFNLLLKSHSQLLQQTMQLSTTCPELFMNTLEVHDNKKASNFP
jgi:hypothetical protein